MNRNFPALFWLASFLLIFSLSGIAQDWEVQWNDPLVVNVDGSDNNRPKISVNASNEPVVIWGKDNGRTLYTAKLDGESFTDPTELTSQSFDIFTSDWAGPEMGSNGDVIFVVFKRYPENLHGVYSVKSLDGGTTWSDTIRVDNIPVGDIQSRFPNVVVDDNGNPAVTIMTFTGNYLDPEYEILTSTDGGANYGELVNASTGFFDGEVCDCCTAEIVFDGSRLVQVYRNNDENIREIRAVMSQDWGQTFVESFEIDNSETYSNVCFSSGPNGIIMGDNLLSAYRVNTDQGPRVMFSSMNLATGSQEIEEHIAPEAQPSIGQTSPAVAGDGDWLGVVWQEETTNDDNIHFAFSSTGDQGIINAPVEVLNFQLPGKQVNADLAFKDEVFHAVWQDKATGLVMYRKGTIVEATDISDLSVEISVFPNPSTDLFQVALGNINADQYKVYDGKGALILTQTITSPKLSIDLSSFKAGVYWMEVLNNDQPIGKAIQLQRL